MKRTLLILALTLSLVSCNAEPEEDLSEELLIKAEQGDAEAQFMVGYAYDLGKGVEQDSTEAARWYLKAAKQGDWIAQNNLGVLYAEGNGVPHDYNKAHQWWLKSAEQGYEEAQCNLGVSYDFGEGVIKDHEKAVYYFLQAAKGGHPKAQYNLGIMYAEGEGIARDYMESYKWLRLSEKNGYDTNEAMDALKSRMTSEQIAQAQRQADAFVAETEKKQKESLFFQMKPDGELKGLSLSIVTLKRGRDLSSNL
jgi:TPR repeat protein